MTQVNLGVNRRTKRDGLLGYDVHDSCRHSSFSWRRWMASAQHCTAPGTAPRCRMAAAQAGYTLIEVLVVAAIFVTVMGALVAPMVTSANVQKRDTNYAYAQQEARTGLDGMVSQIRQAWAILSTDPNAVEMDVNLNGTA